MGDFILYFIVGGLVVSLTTYYGSKGHGFLAAFISMFPCMTILTFALLHKAGGKMAVVAYAKSLIYLVLPWILYILVVAFLCEKMGVWKSIALGVVLYMLSTCLVMHLKGAT